jgi:SAM-dependent methyltransferase/uncharacterized membrane protein YbhN (UPF0104 family)
VISRRLWWFYALLAAAGMAIAALWVILSGAGEYLSSLRRIRPAYALAMAALTTCCVLIRFVRWQFLLRASGFRTPTRPTLSIFLASLAGIATPLYVGEAIRGVFMRRDFSIPMRVSVWLLLTERLFDTAALAGLGMLAAHDWWLRNIMAALVVIAVLLLAANGATARSIRVPKQAATNLQTPAILLQAMGITLAAWIPTAVLISLAADSIDIQVGAADSIRIFASSTLLGSAVLMPAGVGAASSAAILQLQGLGLTAAASLAIISLVRLATIGFALAVSSVFLTIQLRSRRSHRRPIHFDQIASEYTAQFSSHVWQHLLNRKLGMIGADLPNPPEAAGIGVDLGCGLGLQCREMQRRGYRVFGVDASQQLLKYAHEAGVAVAAGDAMKLPFRDESLDFVYTIGVLHHLPEASAQHAAVCEITRVLKPGGLCIVHETNPRNPLFRFYMGYVFPVLKSIDEGIELWIDPRQWNEQPSMGVVGIRYFTFIPDFVPKWLLKPLLAIERLLESTPVRYYSVHYMAVLRKHALPEPEIEPEQAVTVCASA